MIVYEGLVKIGNNFFESLNAGVTGTIATVSLFKNNVTIAAATVFADLTKADFSGYTDGVMDGAISCAANFDTDHGEWQDGNTQGFAHDGGGTANTIYGWYIHRDGVLIAAGNITPKSMSVVPDTIDIYPTILAYNVVPSGGIAIAVHDSFTGTNGTGLASHTADTGQTWAGSGNDTIQGNQIQDATSGSTSVFVADSLFANASIVCDLITPSSIGAGIFCGVIARYADSSNYLICAIFFNGGSNHALFIQKVVAGTPTNIATSANFTLLTSTTYKIRFTVVGSALMAELWTGGAVVVVTSAKDAAGATNTKHGVYMIVITGSAIPSCFLDNFYVYSGIAAP